MKTIKLLLTTAVLGLLTFTASAQSWLTNGLIAYYPFNGNANDASGNGFNGTVYGATLSTNRFGYTNQAYLFGGPSAYITVPFSSTVFSNDFTTSVWFKANDYANGFPTLLYEENQSLTLQIGGLACGCSGPGHLVSYSAYAAATFSWFLDRAQQTPIGTYCQVVITKAGTNVTMYLNSQVAVTGFVSNPTTQPGNTLWIGRSQTEDVPGAYVFHGTLDDIRIYNRALSSNEVAQLYAIESAPIVNVRKAVYLDSSNLWTGSNYQVQASSDLINWTNQGSVFTATNSYWRSTNYWDVANWNQLFFRLQLQ
jgi:hypothetical protein